MKRFALILALSIASATGSSSQDMVSQYWIALDRDLTAKATAFATEYNQLMVRRDSRPWNVKRARHVAELFDRIYNHPLYRVN